MKSHVRRAVSSLTRLVALAAISCGPSCSAERSRDDAVLRAAEPLRPGLLRHGEWVERTLRGHESEGARAEVLFSPLRLQRDVLDAVVATGGSSPRRYALRPQGNPVPSDGWKKLSAPGAGGALAARRAACEPRVQDAEGAAVPCLWLRLDRRTGDPLHGFRLWVAYRIDP